MPELAGSFWMALLAKMTMTAALVVTASLVAERVGPLLGSLIATLPISSGPAFVFLALDHGPAFLAASARTGLPGFAAIAVFVVAYSFLAQARGTLASVAGALLAWLAAITLINSRDWSVAEALALNAVLFGAAIHATRRHRGARQTGRVPRTVWDIPLRAAVVMAFVGAVVLAGHLLGPAAAGTAGVMPVVFTCVALIMQPRLGGPVSAAMMTNGLLGLCGFVAALAVLAVTPEALGSTLALSLALGICVAWTLIMIAASGRRHPK